MTHLNLSSSITIFTSLCLLACFTTTFVSAEDCVLKSILPGTIDCTIKLSGVLKEGKFPKILVSDLQLFMNDSLKVLIGKENQTIDFFSDGFIVLPPQEQYTFFINTTNDGPPRSIESFEILSEKSKPSIKKLKLITVLVKSNVKLDEPIILLNSESAHSSILLSTENQGVTASSQDTNEKPDDVTLLNEQDFLARKAKIHLKFELNNTVDNFFHLSLIKVFKDCSKKLTVTEDEISLPTINNNTLFTMDTLTCVYLLETQTDNLKIHNLDFKSPNSFDSITVKDGLKLTSTDLINSGIKDASKYLNNLERTVSSNGRLLIIFSTLFASKSNLGTITVKKLKYTQVNKEGDFKLSVDKETFAIFSLSDKYPELTLEKAFKLENTDLTVYDSLDLSNEPIMNLKNGETVNNQLWSRKKILVLKFVNSKAPFEVKGKLAGRTLNCNQMSDNPATFTLNGTEELKDQTCNLYFKPKDTDHSVIFNLEGIVLTAESCLSLKYVTSQQNIFKICQLKDVKDSLEKLHLPELLLSSNDSYVLTYDGRENYKGRILVQATFSYNVAKFFRNYTLSDLQPNQVIQSYNFPSNYPFIVNTEDVDFVNSDSFLFVSFETQNLRPGDELKTFNSKNYTKNFIDDFTINEKPAKLPISLVTKFDGSDGKSLISGSFASGFKMNVERVECILDLNLNGTVYTLQTPGYPNKFADAKRCISVINLSDKKEAKYLNITITNGKNDSNYGNLRIYDDFTKHRNISSLIYEFNQTVLKNNETINFNTSSSKIILEFQPADKVTTVNGFQMQIVPQKCSGSYIGCDENSRCILESIRCNYITECIDNTDEMNCVIDHTTPPPPCPGPLVETRGLPGLVITFIIIPLSMLVGWTIAKHGPRLVTRFRGHSYQEFNTFSENA